MTSQFFASPLERPVASYDSLVIGSTAMPSEQAAELMRRLRPGTVTMAYARLIGEEPVILLDTGDTGAYVLGMPAAIRRGQWVYWPVCGLAITRSPLGHMLIHGEDMPPRQIYIGTPNIQQAITSIVSEYLRSVRGAVDVTDDIQGALNAQIAAERTGHE